MAEEKKKLIYERRNGRTVAIDPVTKKVVNLGDRPKSALRKAVINFSNKPFGFDYANLKGSNVFDENTRKFLTIGQLKEDEKKRAEGRRIEQSGTGSDYEDNLSLQRLANQEQKEFDNRMKLLFPKADERISSEDFNQPEDNSLDIDSMSKYSDTGEEEPGDYTDLADLVTGGNDKSNADGTNGTSTRSKLSIGPATTGTGRAAMRAENVERFGEERVSYLERQNSAFQDMKKGKISKEQFAKDFPKSNLAKRLKLKLKK